jgi:hypothetical protein
MTSRNPAGETGSRSRSRIWRPPLMSFLPPEYRPAETSWKAKAGNSSWSMTRPGTPSSSSSRREYRDDEDETFGSGPTT